MQIQLLEEHISCYAESLFILLILWILSFHPLCRYSSQFWKLFFFFFSQYMRALGLLGERVWTFVSWVGRRKFCLNKNESSAVTGGHLIWEAMRKSQNGAVEVVEME